MVTSSRSGCAASTAGSSGDCERREPGLDRALGVRGRGDRALERPPSSRGVGDGVAGTRSSSSPPSVNISSTSTPAGILRPAACCQVPIGSDHACDLEGPGALDVGRDPGLVAVGPLRVLGQRHRVAAYAVRGRSATTSAPSLSWPSRKTVAETGNGSPTVALAGCRPRSTRGMTSRMGIRPTMLVHPCESTTGAQGEVRWSTARALRASRTDRAYPRRSERDAASVRRPRSIGSIQ